MKSLAIASFVTLIAGAASAQPPPAVDVTLSPAVQALSRQFGHDAVDAQRASLQRQVGQAVAHTGAPVRRVDLTIQDIQPNRPTSAELGYSATLNANSFGLGGAAVTGQVVLASGEVLPVRYRYFPPDLQQETNFDTWGDAQETFNTIATGIAKGAPPDQTGAWPPPHQPYAPTGTLIAP